MHIEPEVMKGIETIMVIPKREYSRRANNLCLRISPNKKPVDVTELSSLLMIDINLAVKLLLGERMMLENFIFIFHKIARLEFVLDKLERIMKKEAILSWLETPTALDGNPKPKELLTAKDIGGLLRILYFLESGTPTDPK